MKFLIEKIVQEDNPNFVTLYVKVVELGREIKKEHVAITNINEALYKLNSDVYHEFEIELRKEKLAEQFQLQELIDREYEVVDPAEFKKELIVNPTFEQDVFGRIVVDPNTQIIEKKLIIPYSEDNIRLLSAMIILYDGIYNIVDYVSKTIEGEKVLIITLDKVVILPDGDLGETLVIFGNFDELGLPFGWELSGSIEFTADGWLVIGQGNSENCIRQSVQLVDSAYELVVKGNLIGEYQKGAKLIVELSGGYSSLIEIDSLNSDEIKLSFFAKDLLVIKIYTATIVEGKLSLISLKRKFSL